MSRHLRSQRFAVDGSDSVSNFEDGAHCKAAPQVGSRVATGQLAPMRWLGQFRLWLRSLARSLASSQILLPALAPGRLAWVPTWVASLPPTKKPIESMGSGHA